MRGFRSLFALAGLIALMAASGEAQEKPRPAEPNPAEGMANEFLHEWNYVGRKLITMAEDWPEEQYDFKPNPAQRSFAEQLLHAAGTNALFTRAAKGETVNFEEENPSREKYKTKADVVTFVKKAFADGAATIKEQGDAGLSGVVKWPYGHRMVSRAFLWLEAMEHSGEHYGQLVVYYRVKGIVPPESRPRK